MPSLGFVEAEGVGEGQKIRFPFPRHIEVDVLKPEVGSELLVFIIPFDIENAYPVGIESNVPDSARMVGSRIRGIRMACRIYFIAKTELNDLFYSDDTVGRIFNGFERPFGRRP